MIELQGITWDHPRGRDPVIAAAAAYAREHADVQVTWRTRSLQAFADHSIEELAREFDLLVIDHPHMGLAARSGCLAALDTMGRDTELRELAKHSLGGSHESYVYAGRQWSLAIDAAAQVACYRPDLLDDVPTTWPQVMELAQAGRVLWPHKPVDALMTFFTLCAQRGTPCRNDGRRPLIDSDHARPVLEMMLELAHLVPRPCLNMNPPQIYDLMSQDDRYAYCPLGYGYTNYSREGFRPRRLQFADIPGTIGSTLGGAGIAVSTYSNHLPQAVDFAFRLAAPACQCGVYCDTGGQPAHADAWIDNGCNAQMLDFFRRTRATMDHAYIRPRYDGYLDFQDRGGNIIHACLAGEQPIHETLDQLEQAYDQSLI
ncbi:MAG: extracellular solute-binding protein [Phycisphaeraceae bacterium]|nr:extracellular solute-binding protein [Phycisphaeraceae bacterium]